VTVVDCKEFITNEDKYFDLALNGGVCIQRGGYFFHLGSRPVEAYEMLSEKLQLYSLIEEGLVQARQGKVKPMKECIKSIRTRIIS